MSLQTHSLSVVIPCFNEAHAIDAMARECAAFLSSQETKGLFSSIEFLVVDDGSLDQSLEMLRNWPFFRVIRLSRNSGYGSALKAGFREAQGSLIGYLDLDATYSVHSFVAMARELILQDLDVIFGRRPRQAGSEMPVLRRFGNSFFAGLTRALVSRSISDVCTGQRLFRRKVLPLFLSVQEDGLDYSLALTLTLLATPQRIAEVGVPYRERLGSSKLSVPVDGAKFLWALTKRVYGQNHLRAFSRLTN